MEHVRFRPKQDRLVLPTESAEQFEREHLAFESAIKPRDRVEQMQVEDIAYHDLKVSQRRRIAFGIFKEALIRVLYDLLAKRLRVLKDTDAGILVNRWAAGDADAKADVHAILEAHGFDETSIEAEAFSRCSDELAAVERSEASHARQRDKTLPSLAFYREMMARQSQQSAIGSLENREVT